MAQARKPRDIDAEVYEAYIRDMLNRFLAHRYHAAFIDNIRDFRYSITADYNYTRMAYQVRIRSHRGFEMALLVCEDRVFEVNDRSDWLAFQLQRLEPIMDTMMFVEWFYNALPEDDKRIFHEHCAHLIKSVTFIPPKVTHGFHYQTRFTAEDGRGDRIAPDWLVVVNFTNGAVRREQIQNIYNDIGTWFAMLLMVVNNKELSIDAHR